MTTTQPIAGGNKLSVGLVVQFSSGDLTVSCMAAGGQWGEQKAINTMDADKVDYFQQ